MFPKLLGVRIRFLYTVRLDLKLKPIISLNITDPDPNFMFLGENEFR